MLRLPPGKSRRLAPFPLRPTSRIADNSIDSFRIYPQSAAATFLFRSETGSTQHRVDALQLLAAAKRVRNTISRPVMSLFVDSLETRYQNCPEVRSELRDLLRSAEASALDEGALQGNCTPSTARFYDIPPNQWLSVAARLDEKTTDWPGVIHDSLAHAAFQQVSSFLGAHESLLGLIGYCTGIESETSVGPQEPRRISLDVGVIDPICRKVRAIYWPKGRGREYCAVLSRVLEVADPAEPLPFSSQTLENFVVTPMLREYVAKDVASRFHAAMENLQRARRWSLTLGMVRGVVNGAVFGSTSEADLWQSIDKVKAEMQDPVALNFLILEQVVRKLRAVRFHTNETTYLLRLVFTRLVPEGIAPPPADTTSMATFPYSRAKTFSSVDAIHFMTSQLLDGDILQLVPSLKGRLSVFSEILSFVNDALGRCLTTGSSTPAKWYSSSSVWKLVLSRVPHNEVRMLLGEANCNSNWVKFGFPLSWRCGCGSEVCIAVPQCPSCSGDEGIAAWKCPECRHHNPLDIRESEGATPQPCRSCLNRHPQLEVLMPHAPEVVPCSAGCGCLIESEALSCQSCESPNMHRSIRCTECQSQISGLREDCAECGKPKSESIMLLVPKRILDAASWSSPLRTEPFDRVPDPSSAMFAVNWQCGCGANNSAEKLNCWRCSRHHQRPTFSCPQCLQQNYDPPKRRGSGSPAVPSVFSCNQCAALHPLSDSLSQPRLCACPNCSTVNRSTDAACRNCEAAIGSVSELLTLYPQGPWNCFECGTSNRIELAVGGGVSLSTCSKCEGERPSSTEVFKLDWSCIHCGMANLSGFACTACHSLRPGLPETKARVRLCTQCNSSTPCFEQPCDCGVECSEFRYLPWDCLRCSKRNSATALQQCAHCSHRRATELCERCGDYHLKKACAHASEAKLLGVLEETLLAAGSIPSKENLSPLSQLSSLKPSNWLKAATVFGAIVGDGKRTEAPRAGRRRK